jgi:hypothetical protein
MGKTAVFVFLMVLPMLAAEPGARVEYVGGTVGTIRSNAEGRMDLTGAETIVLRLDDRSIQVPYDRINMIEYGQKVDRRYAEAILISPLMLLAKKRKHFLTVGFTDSEGHQQAVVLRVHKRDVRSVLVGLEAKTGRKVEFQDEEARKAGRG